MREKRQHSPGPLHCSGPRGALLIDERSGRACPRAWGCRLPVSRGHRHRPERRHFDPVARAVLSQLHDSDFRSLGSDSCRSAAAAERAALNSTGSLRELALRRLRPIPGGWTDQTPRFVSKAVSPNDFKWRYPLFPRPLQGSMNNSRSRNVLSQLRCRKRRIDHTPCSNRGRLGSAAR